MIHKGQVRVSSLLLLPSLSYLKIVSAATGSEDSQSRLSDIQETPGMYGKKLLQLESY